MNDNVYINAIHLIGDMSQGIEWGVISRPLRVTFETGEEIVYRYAGTGEKLSEEYLDADGAVLRRRDYIGGFEFVDGKFSRQQVEGGYLTSGRRYHAYVNDYQGNVLGVIDTDIGEAEQYTDYYPYGLPHATAHAPEVSRRKFGGKEYTTEFGFNSCDFGARLHSPLHGSFISPDPKAGDYPHISPYAYCASDPVNFIDPTGKVIIFVNGLDGLFSDSAGKPYWTFNSKDYSFVNGAAKFFNDKKVNYPEFKHGTTSSALERWEEGYKYAERNIVYFKKMVKGDETIKFVTHSMGAAYAEGMAEYLLSHKMPVSDLVHLNAFQANDIKSVGSKYNNVRSIDYQNSDDWIINKIPFLSSPGNIHGASVTIREESPYKSSDNILYTHKYPLSMGKSFWEHLKGILEDFDGN